MYGVSSQACRDIPSQRRILPGMLAGHNTYQSLTPLKAGKLIFQQEVLYINVKD
jgi:hypothetical protein